MLHTIDRVHHLELEKIISNSNELFVHFDGSAIDIRPGIAQQRLRDIDPDIRTVLKPTIDNVEEAVGINRRKRSARPRQIGRQIVPHPGRGITAHAGIKMFRPRIVRRRLNIDRRIKSARRRPKVLFPAKRKCRLVIGISSRQIKASHLRGQPFDLQTEVMLQRELNAFFQGDGPHDCIGGLIRRRDGDGRNPGTGSVTHDAADLALRALRPCWRAPHNHDHRERERFLPENHVPPSLWPASYGRRDQVVKG